MPRPIWYKELLKNTSSCYWCDYYTPLCNRSREHLLPKRWGGANSKDNIVMACIACNQARGSLDDIFCLLGKSISENEYKTRVKKVRDRIGKYYFDNLCCPKKNEALFKAYKTFSNKKNITKPNPFELLKGESYENAS